MKVIDTTHEYFNKIKDIYKKFPEIIDLNNDDCVFTGNAIAEIYLIKPRSDNYLKNVLHNYLIADIIHKPLDKKYIQFVENANCSLSFNTIRYQLFYLCSYFTVFYNFINKQQLFTLIKQQILKIFNGDLEMDIYFNIKNLEQMLQFEEYKEEVNQLIMLLKMKGII